MSSALSYALASSLNGNAVLGRCAMNTAQEATGLDRKTRSKGPAFGFFRGCWAALQERRKREKLIAELTYLNDFELKDIGITRGEIDYVSSSGSIHPRGVRSPG
jgi:uncharacterized protein YjiS (DUF1127 family)